MFRAVTDENAIDIHGTVDTGPGPSACASTVNFRTENSNG